MKAVIQRVEKATLSVGGKVVSEIGKGLAVYLGIERADSLADVPILAKKLAALRIFGDADGKMNLSVTDVKGSVLLISQFTLCASCKRGNRPDFINAAPPAEAESLYLAFGKSLSEYGIPVRYGVFGADMQIDQQNAGPVTIVLNYGNGQIT